VTNSKTSGGEREETLSASASGEGGAGAADAGDPDVLARGSAVGRYVVLARLGAGAMGVVYAAYDPELDRKVALKLLRPQEETADRARRQARMVREAKAIAKVSHPNVVAIHDVGVHEGQVFMAMEHLSGGTLADWLAEKRRPWREIVKTFIAVGQGLAGAHAEGLVHRDFKPDNVLIDKNGVPKVVDFGLVRLSASVTDVTTSGAFASDADERAEAVPAHAGPVPLTRTGALTGTPAYMAPEQFRLAAVDARTDQFAFCISLYEALYGERPFPGTNIIAIADSVTSGRIKDAPKDSQVPTWLRRALLRGLSVDPVRRYASLDELNALLANDPAKRTRRWAMGGAGLMVAVAAVGVAHRLGAQRPMCKGGAARLAGIWEPGPAGDARKLGIHRAFAATGKSYAEQAFTGAARLLDQFAGRWTGMYTEACEATHVRGEQSPEVLDLRMACLNERLGNVRALADVFATADGKVVENAISAAAALPSLDRCADVAGLRAVVKPPEDVATRKRVDALRVDLAQLIALRDSGQCARAMAKADALIADVRSTGYRPLLAEALYGAAQIGAVCGDDTQMLERFREAHTTASAVRDDEVAAQSAALIPPFALNRRGELEVAREWVVVAQGAVQRLGRETLADAMLAQAEGMLALSERAYDRALGAADRSIAITARLLGPDDPLTLQWEANKGDWQQLAGLLDEALRTESQARLRMERVLGVEHPRVAEVWNNQGEALNRLGRHSEAETAYRRSIQLFRQSEADPILLAWSLDGLGHALLGEEKAPAAIAPLEEALAIRSERRAPAAQLRETRFGLARALWSRPAERQRAVGLAGTARHECSDERRCLAEIDTWLTQTAGQKAWAAAEPRHSR
jgi:tRNA A-37 threonylcarbamoyl transferase component Bud32/tetratricopeptide (TPR) repeat protein